MAAAAMQQQEAPALCPPLPPAVLLSTSSGHVEQPNSKVHSALSAVPSAMVFNNKSPAHNATIRSTRRMLST